MSILEVFNSSLTCYQRFFCRICRTWFWSYYCL